MKPMPLVLRVLLWGILLLAVSYLMSSQANAREIIWKRVPADIIQSRCDIASEEGVSTGFSSVKHMTAHPEDYKFLGCYYLEQTSFLHWSCIVAVPDTYPTEALRNALRHEIKHCFLGDFHNGMPYYNDSMDTDLDSYNKQYEELITTGRSST